MLTFLKKRGFFSLTNINRMFRLLKEKFFQFFKIPPLAVRMFTAAHEISGLKKNTLPRELIPLNSLQLARGLLNFTLIQTLHKWIFPYWIVKQYNPAEPSFIPRSHLGLSMNLTNRNWTATGGPVSGFEPVVDPAGAVMPFRNQWSIDVWIMNEEKEIFYPSYSSDIRQSLVEGLPAVKTEFSFKQYDVSMISYVCGDIFTLEVLVKPNDQQQGKSMKPEIIFSVRPFNPEGIALIDNIKYNPENKSVRINNTEDIYFSESPGKYFFSDLRTGDAANLVNSEFRGDKKITCSAGIASAVILFPKELTDSAASVKCFVPLTANKPFAFPDFESFTEEWEGILTDAAEIHTPDNKLNSLIRASLNTLLLLTDDKLITPGPFLYHHFWFRDAAFQLNALDKMNLHGVTKKVFQNFRSLQKNNGFYISQMGEWDSNGQALWSSLHHVLLSDNTELINEFMPSFTKGVKWIVRSRLKNKETEGLLPPGLSAEHLGLTDYYYWDNFWSLAGIKAYRLAAAITGSKKEFNSGVIEEKNFGNDLSRSLKTIISKYDLVTAGPSRMPDYGMIGSIVPLYPLDISEEFQPAFTSTVEYIYDKYFSQDLFFQHFIHSGGNIYLSLQVAHSFLYLGNRKKFNEIFFNVMDYASPTLAFPEAIHPLTGGGIMGDGHHGWAAAEVILAARDAFIYEKNYYDLRSIELILLAGIPSSWFGKGALHIKNAPLLCGKISIFVESEEETINIKTDYSSNRIYEREIFFLCLPFEVEMNADAVKSKSTEGEFIYELKDLPAELKIRKMNYQADFIPENITI
jgi:hypothetical protein